MAENKFIKHLKGTATAGSVLEIKNQGTPATFGNMPSGTSNPNTAYADACGDATGVLKGTDNWKLNGSTLTLATQVYGDGRDFAGTYTASGSSLWVNAIYTFDSAKIFNANTKWVLKLCGANLLSGTSNTIGFSLVVKFSGLPVIAKTFTVAEQANNFCQQFVVDFAESPDSAIKVMAGDTMTIQLLCGDSTASATIYNGMTTVTTLQRRVDGDVVASDTSTFADLEQNIVDIYDALNTKVSKSGDTMTGELKLTLSGTNEHGAIGAYANGVALYAIGNNDSFDPIVIADKSGSTRRVRAAQSNSDLGNSVIPWRKLYVQTINNGYDIAVPNPEQADTLALHSEITGITDLIPAQATTTNQLADKDFVNSSVATNTANFIGTFNSVADLESYSGTLTNNDYAFVVGTDSDGNTVYNRYKYTTATTPASWVFEYALNNSSFTAEQWATINSGATSSDVTLARSAVQPAGLGNGIITLTQGGTTKGTFTTNQSGNTTIDLDAGGTGYHPELLSHEWDDHLRNDTQWLRADTFSWQSGTTYSEAFNALFNDIYTHTTWYASDQPLVRTYSPTPAVGDNVYYDPYPATVAGTITAYDDVNNTITVSNGYTYAYNSNQYVTPTSETVAGQTLSVYTGTSGRKIVTYSDASKLETIYNATGKAWYYVIDLTGKQFKLPREKPFTGAVIGNGIVIGVTDGTNNATFVQTNKSYAPVHTQKSGYGEQVGQIATTTDDIVDAWKGLGITTDPTKSGIMAERGATDQHKYLYFYVGSFTQTALENTAGITAETINQLGAHTVIEFQAPTAGNNYTWYRKYADGWVEQGGRIDNGSLVNTVDLSVVFPVEMADTNYTPSISCIRGASGNYKMNQGIETVSATGMSFGFYSGSDYCQYFAWKVEGMAAS